MLHKMQKSTHKTHRNTPRIAKKIFLMIILIGFLFFLPFISALDSVWDQGPYYYWSFDEGSGTNVVDSAGHNNLTVTDQWSNLGKLDDAYNMSVDAGQDTGIRLNLINGSGSNLTFNWWLRINEVEAGAMMGINRDDANGKFNVQQYDSPSGDDLRLSLHDSAGQCNLEWADIGYDTWVMLTITINSSGATIWKNDATHIEGCDLNQYSIKDANLHLWETEDGNNDEKGFEFDEFGIWNRTLNSSEIVLLYNSGAGLAFGEGETVIADTSVNLTSLYPEDASAFSTSSVNFTINGTTSGYWNFTNATVYVWNSTELINSSYNVFTGNNNQANISIHSFDLDNYIWNTEFCWENATFSNCSFSDTGNLTFDIGATLINITHATDTWETSNATFIANFNILSGSEISLAQLLYNGTIYTISDTAVVGTTLTLTKEIDIPLNEDEFATEQKQFRFRFFYEGASNQTTDYYYQNVSFINLQLCNGTFETRSLNFTMYDELNQTILDTVTYPSSYEIYFDYWMGGGDVKKNYSFQNLSGGANYTFCLYPNTTFYTDMDLDYSAGGYAENNYYLRNSSISNVSQNFNLFLLPSALATKFYITIQQGADFVDGAIVQISKHFVGQGIYKTTSIKLTDDDGEFPFNADLDADYRFNIIKDGVVLDVIDKKASCEEAPCTFNLLIEEEGGSAFYGYNTLYAQNIVSNISFNRNTSIVTYNFVDTTGLANYFRLKVSQIRFNNASYVLCDTSTYASSGSIICNLTGYEGSFIAKGYISRSPELLDLIYGFIIDEDVIKETGLDLLFVSMGILITLVFAAAAMSKGNPSTIIFVFGITILGLKIIKFIPFSWVVISTIEIVIFFILMKLKI